jgi:SNF2 family DNA or RNA helicase
MGLGKTISTLMAIDTLIYDYFEITKVLVIAPKRVANTVWPDEVENWSQVKHLKVKSIEGTEKQRINILNEKADIYTIGRENTVWLCDHYGSNLPFDMLVIDESSSFKNHNSQRFEALKLSLSSFDRIVLLTGTPAPNTLIDLWAQLYILDRGQRLGRFISHFRHEYFHIYQRDRYKTYTPKKGAEKQIYNLISDICISMKTRDYTELPPVIVNDIKVKFPDKLQKQYNEFEKEYILELLDKEITAVNASVLANKLLQFANGAIYDEKRQWHEIHDLKLQACKELIEEANGEPVLIAWTYQHDRDRLLKYLKTYKPRELKDKKDIDEWNASKIQVLMMHPASGGHGLNLQFGGHIIIWFGQTWNLEYYDQFNARLPRSGQKHKVIINRLVAYETYDQNVIKSQLVKGTTQDRLLEAVKARIDHYRSVNKC